MRFTIYSPLLQKIFYKKYFVKRERKFSLCGVYVHLLKSVHCPTPQCSFKISRVGVKVVLPLLGVHSNTLSRESFSVARQRGVYAGFRLKRVVPPTSRNFGCESDRGDVEVHAFI